MWNISIRARLNFAMYGLGTLCTADCYWRIYGSEEVKSVIANGLR
jgi:hypothetical protein